MQRYLDLQKLPNGLRVTLTAEGRTELAEILADYPERPDYDHFFELFAWHLANSGWKSLAADEIGALTGCQIIISDDVTRDDDGRLSNVGDVYWHERYQIELATEVLQTDAGLFLLKASS